MKTFQEHLANRELLDNLIVLLKDKTLKDVLFEVFIFNENEIFLNDSNIPKELKSVAKKFWRMAEDEEISEEWLGDNIDILPYIEDIEVNSNWMNSYKSADSDFHSEALKLLEPFIDFKKYDLKLFLERLYYEDSLTFVLICDCYSSYIKTFKGSFGDDEDILEILDWDEEEERFNDKKILRTNGIIYVIDDGYASLGEWFEISQFDLKEKIHQNFNQSIHPESIYGEKVYQNPPDKTEEILEWLYKE